MRRSLQTRLIGLEKLQARHDRVRDYAAGLVMSLKAIEHVQQVLDTLDVVRGSKESLAEALARALRIDCHELGCRLRETASGRSFWKPDELAALSGREAKL